MSEGVNKFKVLVPLIRSEFEKQLASKTGWGRNELMVAFDKSVVSALSDLLDQHYDPAWPASGD